MQIILCTVGSQNIGLRGWGTVMPLDDDDRKINVNHFALLNVTLLIKKDTLFSLISIFSY